MALSKTELIDMIERIDETKTTLDDIRHRIVQELDELESQEA